MKRIITKLSDYIKKILTEILIVIFLILSPLFMIMLISGLILPSVKEPYPLYIGSQCKIEITPKLEINFDNARESWFAVIRFWRSGEYIKEGSPCSSIMFKLPDENVISQIETWAPKPKEKGVFYTTWQGATGKYKLIKTKKKDVDLRYWITEMVDSNIKLTTYLLPANLFESIMAKASTKSDERSFAGAVEFKLNNAIRRLSFSQRVLYLKFGKEVSKGTSPPWEGINHPDKALAVHVALPIDTKVVDVYPARDPAKIMEYHNRRELSFYGTDQAEHRTWGEITNPEERVIRIIFEYPHLKKMERLLETVCVALFGIGLGILMQRIFERMKKKNL